MKVMVMMMVVGMMVSEVMGEGRGYTGGGVSTYKSEVMGEGRGYTGGGVSTYKSVVGGRSGYTGTGDGVSTYKSVVGGRSGGVVAAKKMEVEKLEKRYMNEWSGVVVVGGYEYRVSKEEITYGEYEKACSYVGGGMVSEGELVGVSEEGKARLNGVRGWVMGDSGKAGNNKGMREDDGSYWDGGLVVRRMAVSRFPYICRFKRKVK